MNRASALLLAPIVPSAALATSPGPGFAQCALIEQVIQPAALVASTRQSALDVLDRIVTQRAQEISAESEKQLSLQPGQLRQLAFGAAEARVCAARSLGKTGLPEGVALLQSMNPAEAPDDRSQRVWSAIQIALREASLVNLEAGTPRERFLENVLDNHSTPGQVGNWAMEELCDSGALDALSHIRAILTRLNNGERARGEEEAGYCEARMQVVARNPDRAKALATVFGNVTKLESTEAGRRLLAWAAAQLYELHSPSADAEMERLARDLGALQKAFPADTYVSQLADGIREMSAMRKK